MSGESAYRLSAGLALELDELVRLYPDRRGALIPALHRLQEELGGWISPGGLEALAEYFGMEPVAVYGVASFYPMFRLKPRGRHLVSVCNNICCELRGAREIMARACEVTGCRPGGTSDDGRFTVVGVECQGACTAAPMFDLDGVYHENLSTDDVERILGSVE
ncbi:MAG: NAD(P)H-dependent oxidoreductase subunit E [Planctomycetota bacterium]|nr:NAD(P)H-dependent oxidoreductase subunit E [Planctomycetota bacterium]